MIAITPYSPDDRPAVVAMMAALQDHERSFSGDRPPGAAIAAGHFAYLCACCDRQSGAILVARSAGAVIAFAVVLLQSEEEGDLHLDEESRRYGLLTDLYVDTAWRGRGVAAQLVAAAENHCRTQGVTTLRITTLAANREAGRCYEKLGYRPYEITYGRRLDSGFGAD